MAHATVELVRELGAAMRDLGIREVDIGAGAHGPSLRLSIAPADVDLTVDEKNAVDAGRKKRGEKLLFGASKLSETLARRCARPLVARGRTPPIRL